MNKIFICYFLYGPWRPCLGSGARVINPDRWAGLEFPETRFQTQNIGLGSNRETLAGERQENEFTCVCGKSFSSVKGRNIHRGKMKCSWRVDNSVDPGSVISREEPGPDTNHSAEDIRRLLSERHGLEPPPARKEKVKWPKSNDKAWEEFDLRVCERMKEEQKGLRFQERMRSHCEVVYEEGVKWFGLIEMEVGRERVNKTGDRRTKKIAALVAERRELRKKVRRARTEMEKNGFKALIKVLNGQLTKLRRAEARRKKQADKRRTLNAFKKNPFGTIKKILCPTPVGELKCTKEELDVHLEATYGDPCRGIPLGPLEGLPDKTRSPTVPFKMTNITRKEHDEIIRKARAKSAPGNNGISYVVYKRCPGISENLWAINRVAFVNGYYPDNCRFFEGVYIPKTDGDFGPATGRPISLGNVQGKIFLAVVARRMTEFMVNNKYVDMSVQKGGLPSVKGCIEHFGAMWEVIKDARLNRRDLSVVWLDLANAYGAVPHLLILKALRFYNVPDKIIKIIVIYFAGVYGRFSSRVVTSKWQKFEIGIFMGCVISVIIFVLCMNLSDEYLKVKVPRAIQYIKESTPVPVLKLFMDDSCLTTSKVVDMQEVLKVVSEFVKWSRFKLKSSKSRALVYDKGKVVEWSVERDEEDVEEPNELLTLTLGGEVIPNVAEKPIKFLGRWIRAQATDKEVTEQARSDLYQFLERLDGSGLTGLQKCWGYQYLVLPKMKWVLAIYDIPASTVLKWEQKVNRHLRSWLGAGHTLSRLCLFSRDSPVALPIDSLMDTWKVEKCRLQQSYKYSPDEFVRSVAPKVRSGRVWEAGKVLEGAERDLMCESMLGMVQPAKRAGIGFGDWKKPWEKMDQRERKKAAIERVGENLQRERVVEYGSLELQSGWTRWREDVLTLDMSWNSLFKMGDSMVGFLLRAVYGTLVTPSLAVKWNDDEDGKCKLCGTEAGTAQHILSGCSVALQQGRYTWRHDKVLNQIQSQVAYHIDKRVNNPKRSISQQRSEVPFVKAGVKGKDLPKRQYQSGMGILTEARDWVLLADVNGQLKFPSMVATTRLRPDLIIYSTSTKRIVWWELTCPCEERISAAHELKLDRYSELQVKCEENGWSCFNMAVEVGARGVVAESLKKAAAAIGMRGRAQKKLVRDVGNEACHCSKWLYWLRGKKDWECRDVGQ